VGPNELGYDNNIVGSQSGFTHFKEQSFNRDDTSLTQYSLRVNWATSIHEPFEFRLKLEREGMSDNKVKVVPEKGIRARNLKLPVTRYASEPRV
jgi:hypothetical protein